MQSRLVLALLAGVCLGQEAPDSRQKLSDIRNLEKQGAAGINKLEQFFKDPDAVVRRAAAKAIAGIGSARSLEPLLTAAADPDPETAVRAMDGLVNFYVPGYQERSYTPALRRDKQGLLSAGSPAANEQLADPGIVVRPEVIAALRQTLGKGDLLSRAAAARGLGVLRTKAALPELSAALRSKDDNLIFESLIALQKIGDASSGESARFLVRDFSERVQLAAVETAGILRVRAALPDLAHALNAPTSSKRVRRAALGAMAMMPDETSRSILMVYFADKDDGMRAAAAEGLARLGSPADAPVIDQALQTERKTNVLLSLCFAAVALGRTEMKEDSPLSFLIGYLDSRAWRGVARPLLTELARREPIRRQLLTAVPQARKEQRAGLAYILGETAGPEALDALDALSRDPSDEVSQAGMWALRAVRARQAR
jgi:HEAT repeat protein